MIVDTEAELGEVIWRPAHDAAESSNVGTFIRWLGDRGIVKVSDYDALWAWSTLEFEAFWAALVEFCSVVLGGESGPVTRGSSMPDVEWFAGRTVNYAEHLMRGRSGTALIARGEGGVRREVSWNELRSSVASFSQSLRKWGVGPGDRVVAVLPNITEAVAAFLATASIGAVWSVCAPEFGTGAIVSRFAQLEPRVLVASPGYQLGGRNRDRTNEMLEIVAALPSLERIVWVTGHTSTPAPPVSVPTVQWSDAAAERLGDSSDGHDLRFEQVGFEHPLWVLFSSGTTGVPKGIVHGHGGALLESLKMLILHSDLKPGDRYFNVASTSWVLWNSLVGSLGVGAVPVLVDGNPTFPSLDAVWRVVGEERVAAVGVGAGFVHASLKAGLRPALEHELTALRTVQVTGSPLSEDGFRWIYREVGDVWLASMSGGTDIASVFVAGSPTLPVRVGRIQTRALAVDVQAWNDDGEPVERERGELVVTKPLPSMPLFFWGDSDGSRYRSSYFATFPGVWRHGDFIEFDSDGSSVIHGRSDSTLNRSGIRLGSADIYRAVEQLPEIAEALVIGAEFGADYYMPLFVVLSDGVEFVDARHAVIAAIRSALSPRYLPDEIIQMRGVPHTRTGKKLEVPVKRLIQGADIVDVADLGAVDDPELLREYARFAAARLVSAAV